MTLLYTDGFDHYATAAMDHKGWSFFLADNHKIATTDGRRGTQSMFASGLNTGSHAAHAITPDSDTFIVGAAMKWSAFPGSDRDQIRILNNVGTEIAIFTITPAGELEITSGGQTKTTASSIWTPTQYNYYELKYTKGTGANSFCELRKDGIALLTINTGTATTQASSIEVLEKDTLSWSGSMDDLYVLNGLGTTNNDYLGDVRVDTHYAIDDGADTDFVPFVAGTNFAMVDEVLTDSDTTFVEAGSINARDLNGVTVATLGTQIHAVQQVIDNRKTDAGTVTVDVISEKPAGTGEKINANAQAVSDNYQMAIAVLETDPDDSTTWTDAKLNAQEFGYKIDNIVT